MIQEVIDEFIAKRKQAGRPRPRWWVSRGARRSLGGIPFSNQDIEIDGPVALLWAREIRLWKQCGIEGHFKSGNFSQDVRRRWYCNIVCEIECQTTARMPCRRIS